ncbi:MAG TPA: carboxymuconolactone decarboxylase family protein [Baekduia sp.]|uniref:carboxymuconolactone decarboxylase family protein n=1 Tax=Baekduia sp. TaxID=2600305 RepID=UPI002BFB344F|nr:carboxymuconolactone decarboxylase family protein [Baekduia sp.]HMJ37850.1 carboxymuconolactone decarboxylase family protein [Baekduia sp.]
MTRIAPVPEAELSDYFRDLVARDEAEGRDSALNGVMAHHAAFFEQYFSFFYPAHEQGVLDTRIKEIARLEVARLNNCTTCLMARYASATRDGLDEDRIAQLDLPEAERDLDDRERLAVEFADRMAYDHQRIDQGFIDQLAEVFSPAEILELGMMIGQYLGFGRLLVALDIHEYSPVTFVPGLG